MSTATWIPDGGTPVNVVIWENNIAEVWDYLKTATTLSNWPEPTATGTDGILYSESFTFTAPGYTDPATVPGYNFPLGCVIQADGQFVGDNAPPDVAIYPQSYLERHGVLRVNY